MKKIWFLTAVVAAFIVLNQVSAFAGGACCAAGAKKNSVKKDSVKKDSVKKDSVKKDSAAKTQDSSVEAKVESGELAPDVTETL